MKGYITYDRYNQENELLPRVKVHANHFEMGEVAKAVETACIALSEAYRATDDRDKKSEYISAEVTIRAIGDAFRGKSIPF